MKEYAPVHFEKREIPKNLTPVTEYVVPTEEARLLGKQLLSQGKVGCLILAGGQGTRFGALHPKALTPVTAVRQKTLLQLICEKTAAASKIYNASLPLAVMTSPHNHGQIESYLSENGAFGVKSVSLFEQMKVPLLTEEGHCFLESSGEVAAGPDGNGHALRHLINSGIGKEWKEQGIEYVMVVPIDNPLADPFDAGLIGYHAMTNREATLKAILRSDPSEKVGVVVRHEGKIGVQEYSELPTHFEAPLAHIGLFCFSLSFVEQVAKVELPWHFAHKIHHGKPIWKPEKFLFDVLAFSNNTGIVVYPREDVYAPLKNASGDKSLETVQQALIDFDRRLLNHLTNSVYSHRFELDPAFYYLEKWKGKSLSHLDYIAPDA